MVESTIDSLKEYKSLCEFNANDFKADKLKLYEKVRQLMARKYVYEEIFKGEKPIKRKKLKQYQMCPNLLITNANISSTGPETLGGC